MNIMMIGDIHIMGKNPVARLDNLPETQREKCNEILEICDEYKVSVVCTSGDFFDYPYQNYQTFFRAWNWLTGFVQRGIKVFTVYGQHDLFFHNLENAHSTILYTFVRMGLITTLTKDPVGLDGIYLYGASYSEDIPNRIDKPDSKHVLVIHKMIAPRKPWATAKEGEDYVSPQVLYNKDWFDFVLCGDWHGQFYWKSKADTYVVNPGALSRKTGGVEDYDRHPCVVVWDTKGNEVDEILLDSAKPSEEVLSRSHIEAVVKSTKGMKDFVARVKAGGSSIGPSYMANLINKLFELRRKKKISRGLDEKIQEAINASHYKKMLNQMLRGEHVRHIGDSRERTAKSKKVGIRFTRPNR